MSTENISMIVEFVGLGFGAGLLLAITVRVAAAFRRALFASS